VKFSAGQGQRLENAFVTEFRLRVRLLDTIARRVLGVFRGVVFVRHRFTRLKQTMPNAVARSCTGYGSLQHSSREMRRQSASGVPKSAPVTESD